MKPILRKTLRRTLLLLLSLLLLLLILLALVVALVATEFGSRWVVGQAAQRLPLEVGQVRGNLLTGLDIGYLEYQMPGEGQRYRVETLSFRWRPGALLYNTLSVQSLHAETLLVQLPPRKAATEQSEPLAWPDLALPVMIEVGDLQLGGIRVEQGDRVLIELDRVSGSANLGLINLRIADLEVVRGADRLGVDGRLGLRYPYPSQLALEWQFRLPGDQPLDLAGSGELSGDLEALELQHRLSAPLTLETRASVNPHLNDSDRSPHVELFNRWQDQSPPAIWLPQDQPVPVSSGEMTLTGWLEDYQLSVQGRVSAGDWPELGVSLDGSGDLQQFRLAELALSALDTRVEASGHLHWEPALAWQLEVQGQGVNPADLLEGWPGDLSFSLTSSGEQGADGQWQGELENWQMSGQLRGLAVQSEGQGVYRERQFATEGIALSLGANQLHLVGSLGDRLNLHWQIYAPLLDRVDPSLSGNLSATGSLTGTVQLPRLEADMTGRELRWQDYRIGTLKLVASSASAEEFTLALAARDLQWQEQTLKELSLSGEGNLQDHRLRLTLGRDDLGSLSAELGGAYREAGWHGRLQALSLNPHGLPPWQLLSSEPVSLAANGVELGEQCFTPRAWGSWTQGDSTGSVCLLGSWLPGQGVSARGEIAQVPLQLIHAWLKPEVALQGVLEGSFSLTLPDSAANPDQSLSANLSLATRDGEFHYRYEDQDVEVYALRSTRLEAAIRDRRLDANWLSEWQGYGNVQARLGLQLDTGELDGRVQASFDDLAPLEAMVPRLHNVRGNLTARFDLSGTLEAPEFPGRISLTEGTANVPELGLALTAIELTVDSLADGRLEARGGLTSGEGSLTLTADAQGLLQGDWRINGRLEGEEVQIIQTPEMQARVSPSLALSATAEELRLSGSAEIPQALAEIKTLPESAIRVSDDVVVLDASGRDPGAAAGMLIYTDIRLRLGDEVRFRGLGVDARLSGELTLLRSPARGLLVTGDVSVAEGVYEAYGQDLDIERGRLLFQGPYDNPGLDILAVRTTRTHRAGLEITGTLQRPRSRVFSVPAESESDALAILVTGSPLTGGKATSADASMVINAVGTLGLERGQFITEEIAQTFGLDEFTIRTTDDLQQSALWIGKYLTPKLFVRYAVGLFDRTSSIGMRYEINDALRLEAESGTQQSVDLIYSIER